MAYGNFNPRSPCGERRLSEAAHNAVRGISIHAPRAGSDCQSLCRQPCGGISIHAPRAGSDNVRNVHCAHFFQFQSTLPVRGATRGKVGAEVARKFQSTLPVRGATRMMILLSVEEDYFNPRSPCGERRIHYFTERLYRTISIHAPRAGSDGYPVYQPEPAYHFNPRSPCGERLVAIT